MLSILVNNKIIHNREVSVRGSLTAHELGTISSKYRKLLLINPGHIHLCKKYWEGL